MLPKWFLLVGSLSDVSQKLAYASEVFLLAGELIVLRIAKTAGGAKNENSFETGLAADDKAFLYHHLLVPL
ncbi:hypothetical protein FHS14_005342 [Paenibacillus baekrokdamisoli]|nr:hypothetical protein [Paenibacillus baekrokdamisoli]